MTEPTPTHHRDVAQIPQQTKADLIRQCQDRSAKWAVAKRESDEFMRRLEIDTLWEMTAWHNGKQLDQPRPDYAAPQDFAPGGKHYGLRRERERTAKEYAEQLCQQNPALRYMSV